MAELELLRERLIELEDFEVQRISEEQERFDSLNVLDEYAQQLEESRDKLARLLQAGVAIEEARSTQEILQTAADAVGSAGWASAVVYLLDNFEIVESAYFGVCDEDIDELARNRRPADERARMFSPAFDEFKVSRSYFVPSHRLHEFIHTRYVVPGRRESLPGDEWDPMDLVYIPMYSSTGKILGTINCDDPVNGKRPSAQVFQYLEIFADLAARKVETVQLLNRQAQIEAQLRESEEKYRTIFDRSADGFLLMDDLFRECNDATLKLFGCEQDDIVGHSPAEFSPKYQADGQRSDKLAAEYISRARSGIPQNFEWTHLRKDGAELFCEVSLAAIDVSGRAMIMAIVRDVSERKRVAHDKDTTAVASQLFLSARSIDLIYSQLPKILTSRFPLEIAAVELYDPSTDELVLVGEENTGLPLGFRVASSMSVSGTVVRTGDSVVDAQTSRRPDYAHADLRRLGLQKLVCVPLHVRDQVIGVIWLGNSKFASSVEGSILELNQILIPLNIIANYLAQAIDRQRAEEELVDLKQFFEKLLDNLPAQVAVYDPLGNYRYANKACIEDESVREWAIGKNDEDLQGKLGANSDVGRNRSAAITKALQTRNLVTFEELTRDSLDRQRYYLKAISPVTDAAGIVEYVIGYGQDITNTKLWEQEQKLLRQLPTENPFPVLACGSDGRVLYMNRAAERLAMRAGDIGARGYLPEDHHSVVAELALENESCTESTSLVDGKTYRWTYCRSSDGRIQIYGVELPAALSLSSGQQNARNTHTDALRSGLSAPVWIIDHAGNTVMQSQAAENILSSHGADGLRNLIDDRFWTRILSLKSLGDSAVQESQFLSRAWKWTATLVQEQLRLVELQDVTDTRDLQDKLRHAQKLEAVGRLAGGIAHDFNNLLTAIIGNLELLEHSKAGDDHTRGCAREAAHAAERASALVKQLLSYSRKSADTACSVDPNNIISAVAKMLARTVDRRITVEEKLMSEGWTIAANPHQLEQILMNLGVNAADAIVERISTVGIGAEQPKIFITTEKMPSSLPPVVEGKTLAGDFVAIKVKDNGCGISPNIRKRVFDAFFTTKAENYGTGLGLSIVAELVEALGGHIEVNSQEGHGTEFIILFPKSDSVFEETVEKRTKFEARGGTETVLLVDDEPVIIDLGQEVLEQAGYTVMIARDGQEALQLFEKHIDDIDLVIMDISLPRMSGDEAVSIMLSLREDIPVILSTGLPDAAATRKRISLGSVAFIQKPYRPSELLGSVREVLDHVNS